MNYSHIIWDWNGTLLDDVGVSVDCVNDLLVQLGKKETNIDEYYLHMDSTLINYYANHVNFDEFSFEKCTIVFQNSYSKRMNFAKLSKNALEMLRFAQNNTIKQYIISSFEEQKLKTLVSRFEIESFFEEISGADDTLAGEKLTRAKSILKNVDPEKIVVIGDTLADHELALGLNCDCILYTNGHQSFSTLEETGRPLVNDLIEVKDFLYSNFALSSF